MMTSPAEHVGQIRSTGRPTCAGSAGLDATIPVAAECMNLLSAERPAIHGPVISRLQIVDREQVGATAQIYGAGDDYRRGDKRLVGPSARAPESLAASGHRWRPTSLAFTASRLSITVNASAVIIGGCMGVRIS